MLKKRRVSSGTFQADQLGINQLKNDFFSEAREFSYFRKGEWQGVLESIRYAYEWAQANPQWVAIAVALYLPSKDLVAGIAKVVGVAVRKVRKYFGRPRRLAITRRVICSKGIDKSVVKEWESICGIGSVVTIPKIQVGQFRYIVNEKRYAIFSRFGPNDLRGIIGSDRETILMLRQMFDREFIEADIRNKIAREGFRRR